MVHTNKHHPRHHPVTEAADAQAHPHGIRAVPVAGEMPQINRNKVSWLQQLLMAAGFPLIGGADGIYGDSTHEAARHIAQEAHLDLHSINFNDPNSANTKTFLSALAMHKQAHDPVVAALATGQPLAPLTPVMAPAMAPAVDDPRIPLSIRNTAYDPRAIAHLSDPELNNLIKQGLHDIGEIRGGFLGQYHRNGQLSLATQDKVKEQQRKLLGVPEGQETLDRAGLERTAAALGVAVAQRVHLDPRGAAPTDPRIPAAVNGTEYDPRALQRVSDAQLNNILKDGLYGLGEIHGGIFGSYHRNGELGEVTTAKIFEQERKLLGLKRGEETLDRQTLENVATAMGTKVAQREHLAPEMDAALNSARTTSGALPPEGAVSPAAPVTSVTPPPAGRAPADLLPPGQYTTR